MALATAAAVVFLALLALEFGGQIQTPYLGLLLFIAVPAVFVSGLVPVPIGVWCQHCRSARQKAIDEWDRLPHQHAEDGRWLDDQPGLLSCDALRPVGQY